jgi:hypothetical protein
MPPSHPSRFKDGIAGDSGPVSFSNTLTDPCLFQPETLTSRPSFAHNGGAR